MISFVRGIQSRYDALVEKSSDALYFITDTQRVYLNNEIISSNNIQYLTEVPSSTDAIDGVLYVVTKSGKTELYAKVDESVVPVGGGEATTIADGIVTFSKFNTEIIASTINTEAPSSEKIVTESAVTTYVEGIKSVIQTEIDNLGDPIVDASYVAPGTEGLPDDKFGLKFVTASGDSSKVIQIDKENFLSDASYDSETHTLTLTLSNGTSFSVNLSDLVDIANAKTVKTVDESINVELGTGGTLGGYKTGDIITAGTPIQTVIAKLLAKQVPPTYAQPTISIANNGGTASGSYEEGSTLTVKLKATFNNNDAGELQSISIKRGSEEIATGTASPFTAEDTETTVLGSSTISYSATASYAEGAIKNDNLGEPYPEGHIAAGSKTSSNYTFTSFRKMFAGGISSESDIDSDLIRGLSYSTKSAKSTYFNFNASVGNTKLIFAFPTSLSSATPTFEYFTMSWESFAGFTLLGTVQVADARGGDNGKISYNVYTYSPASAFESDTQFRVKVN